MRLGTVAGVGILRPAPAPGLPRHVLPAVVVLAGLLGAAGVASAVVLLEDAAGDAQSVGPEQLRSRCYTLPPAWERCASTVPSDAPGAPAPADRDILAVEAELVGNDLVLTLVVPELRDEPMRLENEAGSVEYLVCADEYCAFSVRGVATEQPDIGYIAATAEGCSWGGWCLWGVNVTFDVGSPGYIAWRFPVDVLPDPWDAVNVTAAVYMWDTGAAGSDVWIPFPDDTPASGGGISASPGYYLADGASGAISVDALDIPPGRTPFPALPSRAGQAGNAPSRLDIVSVELSETSRDISLRLDTADLDAPDGPLDVGGYLAFETAMIQVSARAVSGQWAGSASICVAYDETWCLRWASLPVDFTVESAEIDTMTWTMRRVDVGAPAAGDPVHAAGAYIQDGRADDPASAFGVWLQGTYAYDVAILPPARFALDSVTDEAPAGGAVVSTADDLDDVDEGLLPLASSTATLDVTFVEAQRLEDGITRFALGISEVADLPVPAGYDAVVYVVGLETVDGRFMIGLYRTPNGQEFFCAQDTVVFAEPRLDPLAVARQPVVGAIATGAGTAGRATSQEGGGASITVFAPDTCFAHVGGGELVASRLAGGTFLVQNPGRGGPLAGQAQVAVADDAAFPAAVTLAAAAPVVPPTPWYANPFGIDSFYDIAGVVLAVLASLVGLLAVRRRRSLLQRYLKRVDDAAATPEAKARAKALEDVRAALKADLTRGRMSEGHYVIVERRLDAALVAARGAAIRGAFADLPLALVATLETLLADGDMSRDDYRVFLTQLDGMTTLTQQAKADARERVQRWVAGDSDAPA